MNLSLWSVRVRMRVRIAIFICIAQVCTTGVLRGQSLPACIDDFEKGVDMSQWTTVSTLVVQTNPAYLFKCSGQAALVGTLTNTNSFAITKPIDTSNGARLSYYVNPNQFYMGPCVVFEYSVDNGQSWTAIRTHTPQEGNGSWIFVDMDAPDGARSPATLFKWREADWNGGQSGMWGLDRVRISTPNHSGPYFRWMPSDRITYPGSIVNLRPEVEGTAPMNFQWCRDGAPVAGLTDENLVLGNVQTNQAGAYTLVISNQFWVSTSSVVNVSFTSVPYRPRIWAFLNDNYNFGGRPGVSTESTGAFAQVYDGGKDMLQWSSTDLSPFDAAVFEMMFADSAYDSLGDRMADFVDSGGGLVATVFRGSKQTFGRLTSDHYLPFTTGGADSEPFAGVVFDTPSHPMLDGVKPYTSVWGDYHGIGIGVVPGSSLVAHWSDGSPFLGTKQKAGSGRVVGYNSEDSTDPLRLVVNSWLWAARAPAPEPKIVSEPASVGVTPGTFASVVAYVSGASPMGFQWYRNGSLVPGAMDSAFNVVYPQMGDDATYTYVATNAYGSVASTATVLTVQIAPSITAQPQSLTVHSGNSASLSVGATGTSLQYQWYKNGDVLAGATSATLSIGNVSVADDADYSVQVSNLVGSEASLTVHLTVLTAPIFLQQPASQTVQAGGAVTLSCNVGPDTVLPTVSSGNLRLWLDANAKVDADSNNFVSRWGDCSSNHWNAAQSDPNWQPVLTHPDALHGRAAMHFEDYQITGSFLTNSTLSFHGAYTAFLVYSHDTGGAGFMTPFQMDSFDADEFTNGESHPFSGFALWPNGEIGVITWDWIDSGISMPANMWHVETLRQHTDAVVDVTSQSANAATNTTLVEGGNYLWQSGYHLGRLAGDIAEVIVYEGALSDVDQAAVGQFLNDKYFLNNVRGFGFQWQLNGVDIAGATNQTLQLSDVQASQGGTYTVVVTDNGGTSTSVGAVVTVNGPGAPQIVVQPQTHAVNFGDTVSVFVTTSGNSPMAYQWFKDGSLVSGATDSSYTVTGFSAADAAGYSVRISNDAGSVTSAAGLIGVPPQIVQQPQSVVVPRGQPFQMAVQASGTGLSYCWRFHSMLFGVSSDPTVTGVSDFGAVIRFQTNSIYGRDASTMADNGGYSVVISNAFGMVTSAVVIVATAVQPNFTTEPSSIKVAEGFRFVLPSHAEGGVLSYQWYKNGSAIPGGTQENYNAWRNTVAFGGSNAATIFDAGSYYCVASNIVGTATSATATLTVTTDTSKVWISSPRLVLTGDYSAGLTMQGWIHDDLTDGTVTVNGGATYPVTITYWNMIYNLLAWTCTITDCPPGAVTLTAAARGNDGTTYHFVTTVFNSPAITLQGGVNGPGTVSPSLFGTSLRFGSNYTMTATPVAGAFFTGWSTDEGVISTDPALRFTMTTNLHLYANFVADPFASVLGNFNGLFSEDVVTAQTAGSVTVKVLKKGVYSGTLKRGNRSYGISGKFDLSGHATHFVRALNSTVDMHFDFAHAQITGAITGVGANAELRAVRAPFSATSPSGFTGKYAMVLPASASSGSGHGYGLINHTANGTINLLPPSSLGDGTAISQSVGVGANGEWPVYARVNGGTGLLFGWLNFGNARTLSGNVNWVRPNSEVEEIEINGSSYTPATASSGVKLTATCDGGCLTQCVSNTVSVGTTAIAVLAPNTNSLSLKISSASGFLSGSFKVNGTTKKIKGVLLQQQTNGAGFFADAPKNGAVLLK